MIQHQAPYVVLALLRVTGKMLKPEEVLKLELPPRKHVWGLHSPRYCLSVNFSVQIFAVVSLFRLITWILLNTPRLTLLWEIIFWNSRIPIRNVKNSWYNCIKKCLFQGNGNNFLTWNGTNIALRYQDSLKNLLELRDPCYSVFLHFYCKIISWVQKPKVSFKQSRLV